MHRIQIFIKRRENISCSLPKIYNFTHNLNKMKITREDAKNSLRNLFGYFGESILNNYSNYAESRDALL